MGERMRAKHAEWGHLRVAGRPLISSATIGDTPLLWIACRASPRLVHVYEDSHLKMIWRFTSDPIFMSLEKESNSFVKKGFQHLASQNQNLPSLLVVTDDGSVWHLPACLIDERIERPSKRRKEKVNNEGDGGYEENEWGGLFDDLDPYDHMECDNTVSAKVSSSSRMVTAGGSCSKHRAVKTSSLNRAGTLLHAKKMVHSFPSRSFCKTTSTLVMEENLVGIVPNATFASIGPENIVLVFSSFGLQIFHLVNRQENSCTIYMLLEKFEGNASFNEKTTCALLVSSAQNISCSISGHIVLHDKIYSALAHAFIGPVPDYLLLKGILRVSGRICENSSRCTVNVSKLWRDLFPDGFTDKGSLSKAGDKITFMVPGGEVFSITLKCTNECEIQLHVNAPTLLLACLLRDALDWRLKCHETTNVQDKTTAPVTDSVSAMSQTGANVEEMMNQLEMLSDRARILLSTWDEKQRENQDETQDILPLIADIYNVINDILKLYRSSWEH